MKYIAYFFLLVASSNSFAFSELEAILDYKTAPPGVVIEITSGDKLYLTRIIKELKRDILAIQNKFKGIEIAIVSHARESLILTEEKAGKHKELHREIKSLSATTDTVVHVCGTYASWFNIDEDAFPDYINVSPAGPVQVDDYIELGYVHIEL